ncbi:2-oxo-4-hydroxy-4-carboxy-5-ureidoimidazoline decarboxylase [Nocardia sp. NPDC056000]|uniref:2-oxo-4-hydroxy-4-carboxy-5-ureidoimidazoline decarboxylase n=1 Tax=Nocardia sp. NPDC056000 TaxID=3345674 RepID=UPI0035D87F19
MLMHHGIGLDRFNSCSRQRAVHALYECCSCVSWAEKIADGRPYPGYDALQTAVATGLRALSAAELEHAFDSCARETISEHSVAELQRVTRARIERMLGPEEGYPEY